MNRNGLAGIFKQLPRLCCIPILLGFITGCDNFARQAEERARAAARPDAEEIILAVVDSSAMPAMFTRGVALAIDEFNARKLIKQALRAEYYDDRSEVPTAQELARDLADDENVVAVIGHLSSPTALAASIIYDRAGLLLITPGATQAGLTHKKNRFIFRNIPMDEAFAQAIADYFARHKYKRVAVIYDQAFSTRRLAGLFYKAANDAGTEIVAFHFYSSWETDYRELIVKVKKEAKEKDAKKKEPRKDAGFDALFLSGVLPQGAEMIGQLRAMGVSAPIVGGMDFDSHGLMNIAGRAAEDTTVATVFDPKHPKNRTRDFIRRFRKRYGIEPDTWAAQGYDAVELLTGAMVESRSRVPAVLASTLRFTENWQGVTGSYSMTPQGNAADKAIYFKTVKNGAFAFLEQKPGKVDLFETVKDETLRIGAPQGEIHLDPCHVRSGMSVEATEQLFRGLTDIHMDDEGSRATPALATDWEIVPGTQDKVHRFHLRRNAKWSDGHPVTAHDIAWAIRRNILPATGCWAADLLFAVKNARAIHEGRTGDLAQLGVKAIDDYTIEFELEQPMSFFPKMVNHFVYRPLPAHAIQELGEEIGDGWTDPGRIVTNGAYHLAAWEPDMLMILRRNDDYYDSAQVNIPEIRYFFLPNPAMGLTLYRSGQLDLLGGGNYLPISDGEYAKVRADRELYANLHEFPRLKVYSYGFRTGRFPMNLPLVRKAITAALDRETMVRLLAEQHEVSTTFTPVRFLAAGPKPASHSHANPGLGIPFSPNRAKAWLEEAGYPNGQGLPEITLLHRSGDHHRQLARAVQASLLKYLGVKVKPVTYPPEQGLGKAIEENDPHLFGLQWAPVFPDAYDFLEPNFHPESLFNHTGWRNTAFSALLTRSQSEPSPGIRAELFRRAERMVTEEACVVAPLYFERARILIRPRITQWDYMPFGGQYLRDWSF